MAEIYFSYCNGRNIVKIGSGINMYLIPKKYKSNSKNYS